MAVETAKHHDLVILYQVEDGVREPAEQGPPDLPMDLGMGERLTANRLTA